MGFLLFVELSSSPSILIWLFFSSYLLYGLKCCFSADFMPFIDFYCMIYDILQIYLFFWLFLAIVNFSFATKGLPFCYFAAKLVTLTISIDFFPADILYFELMFLRELFLAWLRWLNLGVIELFLYSAAASLWVGDLLEDLAIWKASKSISTFSTLPFEWPFCASSLLWVVVGGVALDRN